MRSIGTHLRTKTALSTEERRISLAFVHPTGSERFSNVAPWNVAIVASLPIPMLPPSLEVVIGTTVLIVMVTAMVAIAMSPVAAIVSPVATVDEAVATAMSPAMGASLDPDWMVLSCQLSIPTAVVGVAVAGAGIDAEHNHIPITVCANAACCKIWSRDSIIFEQ
jgi:hypothetical protein